MNPQLPEDKVVMKAHKFDDGQTYFCGQCDEKDKQIATLQAKLASASAVVETMRDIARDRMQGPENFGAYCKRKAQNALHTHDREKESEGLTGESNEL